MQRKRLPSMSLVVALSATVAACDDPTDLASQRDVYSGPTAFEDCVADWGNPDLCRQQLTDAEKKEVAASGGGAGHTVFLWGPQYTGYDRFTNYNGVRYEPKATHATRSAWFRPSSSSGAKSMGFAAPKPAYSVSSRGGFGSTGRGFSVGG